MRLRVGVHLLLLVLPLSRRGSKRANRPSEEIEVTEVEDVEGLKMCAHGGVKVIRDFTPRLHANTPVHTSLDAADGFRLVLVKASETFSQGGHF